MAHVKSDEQWMEEIKEGQQGKAVCLSIVRHIKVKTKARMKCTICNNIWISNAEKLAKGSGCPYCKGDLLTKVKRKSSSQWIKEINAAQKGKAKVIKIIYPKKGRARAKMKCLRCNNIWVAEASKLKFESCPKCAGTAKITQEEFEKHLFIHTHGKIKMIGSFVNIRKKVLVKCNICNYHFKICPYSFLHHKGLCPYCHMKESKKRLSKSDSQFKQELFKKHKGKIVALIKYKNNKTPIKFKCLVCGYTWETIPSSILYDTLSKCPNCTKKKLSNAYSKSNDKFKQELKIKTKGMIKSIDTYVNGKTKIRFKCMKCFKVWRAAPISIIGNNNSGCPYCSRSHGEMKIDEYLRKQRINFIAQKRFKKCRYKQPLPFDFYIPSLKTCIEYDGIQHYKAIKAFGGKPAFELRKIRDNIKNDFCKKNNIRLIRIPYIITENHITEYLKKVGIK